MNNFTVGQVADCIGTDPRAAAKMLNDAGATPRLDELEGDPSESVDREYTVNLWTERAGDRIGRKLADVLR